MLLTAVHIIFRIMYFYGNAINSKINLLIRVVSRQNHNISKYLILQMQFLINILIK